MSYVKDNLMPNEKVVFKARIHPAIFISAVVSALFGIAIAIFGYGPASHQTSNGTTWTGGVICLAAFFFFLAIVYALQAIIVMFTTEFAVTDRRVIAKAGFIRRHTLEMLLQKIESVGINQDLTGRMMNYGTVTVTGTGGTKERFTAIAEPLVVRKVINEIIEQSAQAK
jgi:uncharacterized membrane protein YdbT with pleckstrin-like domain